MPVSSDYDLFKILIGIITGLLGFIELVAMKLFSELKNTDNELKKNDADLFSRLNDHERRLSTLEGEHRVMHRHKK